MAGRSGVTIKNFVIQEFEFGVGLLSASNNRVVKNKFISNYVGVINSGSSGSVNNVIKKNKFRNNEFGLKILSASKNIMVKENEILGSTSNSIFVHNNSDNIFQRNVMKNNADGLMLWASSNNLIINNRIVDTTAVAISLSTYINSATTSDNNSVIRNTLERNRNGISIGAGNNNEIMRNTAAKSVQEGFYVSKSSVDNLLIKNIARYNGDYGFKDFTYGGTGTAGTDNTYISNRCASNATENSLPVGLCD